MAAPNTPDTPGTPGTRGAGVADLPVRSLEDLLCFDLYSASRAVTALYRPMLDRLGLTYPQYLVLVALSPGEPATVTRIASALSLDHGTLTPLLRRMEGAGLLTRTRSVEDERRVEVSLTTAGEAMRGRFEDVQCVVGDAMGLSRDEFQGMQHSLRTLTRAVRAATERQAAAPTEVNGR